MNSPARAIGFGLILSAATIIWLSRIAAGDDLTITELWRFDSGG